MDGVTLLYSIAFAGFIIYLLGHSFIASFFKHKEELIKRTTRLVKGNWNG